MKRLLLIVSFIAFTINWSSGQQPGFDGSEQGPILRFYPNPATTTISFDFQKPYEKGLSIQIFSFLGRKMYEQVNITDHTTINLTDFTRGVYIYQLIDRTGKILESGKFQVSK